MLVLSLWYSRSQLREGKLVHVDATVCFKPAKAIRVSSVIRMLPKYKLEKAWSDPNVDF